jgi:transcription elongation factor GreA-like protein/transcription elongation GreA/GreB family factor
MVTSHIHSQQGISMGYLKDFQTHIANHDYPSFLKLWEEYCAGDEVEAEEVCDILRSVKLSDIAEPVGRHVERILPLWQKMPENQMSYEVLKLIIDIETSNNEHLAELAYNYLKKRYSDHKHFNDKIRLIGLRGKEKFQGAISNYELLSHMEKGKYVFHTGGWGVGEIVDVSLVREQLTLEFDYVPGKKELPFATAFKTLVPIPDEHFLALRFGSPDLLEKKAKENPVDVIRMLLRDLGPKTASEIKDELCDLVIPAAEWTRWWQTTRGKIKKDTMIATPEDIREPFHLRKSELSHEERLQQILESKPDANTLIQTVYTFLRDFPEMLKNNDFKAILLSKMTEVLSYKEISPAQEIQIHFFLQDLNNTKDSPAITELVKRFESIEKMINTVEVLSFKKRLLMEARKNREDWKESFLYLLFKVEQGPLRDYILSELISVKADAELKQKFQDLYTHPSKYPEAFMWYFQKLQTQPSIPFSDKEGKIRFFEGLLILLSHVENNPEQREMVKKIHTLLSAGRFAIVRQMMQSGSAEDAKEFILLASKSHSLSDHDQKIFHSLAEVAHPSISKPRKKQDASVREETQTIWTTHEGYLKLKQRIQQIATVETVENAKEIETARAHGDLRENAEFKAALEKRDRLQSELKFLSEQLKGARVLTKEDINTKEVDVGAVVECQNKKGQKITYTLLGPWDADPDKNILSFQSKLAQNMKGKTIGDKFSLQNDELTITGIRSFL